MSKAVDLTGRRFGRLTVLRQDTNASKKRRWICLCDCGKEKSIAGNGLVQGYTKSCRCLLRETVAARRYRHGKTGTRVHEIWRGMISRCTRPSSSPWRWYGGRGIKVCDRWLKFDNFYADMGDCPSEQHSIERVDVNGNYEPSNCIWLPLKDQAKNRRPVQRNAT